MINKNLRTALLISLAAHIFGMSAVTIINPKWAGRRNVYPRIDFLGAVFKKTAFDIMIENTAPFFKGAGGHMLQIKERQYLENVEVPKQKIYVQKFPGILDDAMDNNVKVFLTGDKTVPRFMSPSKYGNFVKKQQPLRKKIVYHPSSFFVQYGLYGEKKYFKAKFKALVGEDGKIKRTELLTTTGYPELDIKASRLIKDCLPPAKKNVLENNEWCDVEIILNTVGG